jgi:hypothetical protein
MLGFHVLGFCNVTLLLKFNYQILTREAKIPKILGVKGRDGYGYKNKITAFLPLQNTPVL